MSVEIYGVEESSKKFRCIAVSGENTFNTVWQQVIDDLGLRLIGNGVWLYQKDLPNILEEFARVKAYVMQDESIPPNRREDIAEHIDEILSVLESKWGEVANAERLWMG